MYCFQLDVTVLLAPTPGGEGAQKEEDAPRSCLGWSRGSPKDLLLMEGKTGDRFIFCSMVCRGRSTRDCLLFLAGQCNVKVA